MDLTMITLCPLRLQGRTDPLSRPMYNIEQGMATNRTDENTLKNTATALFAAGSDTVRDSFFLLFRDGTKQLVRLYRYLLRSFLR